MDNYYLWAKQAQMTENNALRLSKEYNIDSSWQEDLNSKNRLARQSPISKERLDFKQAQRAKLLNDSDWCRSSSFGGATNATPRPYTSFNHSKFFTFKEGESVETQKFQTDNSKACAHSVECIQKINGSTMVTKSMSNETPISSKRQRVPRDMKELMAGATWHLRDNPELFSYRHQRKRITHNNDSQQNSTTPETSHIIQPASKKPKTKTENGKRRRKRLTKTVPKERCSKVKDNLFLKAENSSKSAEELPTSDRTSKRFQNKLWFIDYDARDKKQSVSIASRKFFVDEVYEKKECPAIFSNVRSAFDLVNDNKVRYWNDEESPLITVYLSMPVSSYREKYQLSFPKDEELNPFEEIGRMMEISALFYLPQKYACLVRNEDTFKNCIVGQFIKAYENSHYEEILQKIEEYNVLIDSLRSSGVIFDHLKTQTRVPRPIIYEILNQVYSRTVSPNSKKLCQYKAFSNYVYGELLPNFLTQVFNEAKLDSNSTFIDLGSGVGNCAFQAALEYGCESFGCEIMEHASYLCELQLMEFKNRCNIFGIRPGKINFFLRQTFEDSLQVSKVVSKCEVILVNNYLFDANLNAKVISLFQCLKESIGTKIVSLKPVIPLNYTIHDDLTLTNVLSFMKTRRNEYSENSVSWTSKGGVYYITEVVSDVPIELMGSSTRKSKSRI